MNAELIELVKQKFVNAVDELVKMRVCFELKHTHQQQSKRPHAVRRHRKFKTSTTKLVLTNACNTKYTYLNVHVHYCNFI